MFGRVWGHSNSKRVLATSRQDQEPAGFVECKRLGGEQCSGLELPCCCHTAQTRSLAAMLRSSHLLYSKTEGFGADALSPAILCCWAAQPSAWLAAPISTVAKDLREAPISSVSSVTWPLMDFLACEEGTGNCTNPSDDLWCPGRVKGRVNGALLMEPAGLAVSLALPPSAVYP